MGAPLNFTKMFKKLEIKLIEVTPYQAHLLITGRLRHKELDKCEVEIVTIHKRV